MQIGDVEVEYVKDHYVKLSILYLRCRDGDLLVLGVRK